MPLEGGVLNYWPYYGYVDVDHVSFKNLKVIIPGYVLMSPITCRCFSFTSKVFKFKL